MEPIPVPPGTTDMCGGVTFLGTCQGSNAVWCEAGELKRRDCATLGQGCGYLSAERGYYCVPLPPGADTGMRDAGSPAPDAGADTGVAPDSSIPDTGTPDAGAPDTGSPDTGSADTGTPDSGPTLPDPGDVAWIEWPSQQTRSGARWGDALTDIANHLPSSYGRMYDDADLVTFGHETSHGIHAHIRNYVEGSGRRDNAFYVLGNQAALVDEPNIRKSAVAPFIPSGLRGSRFSLYVTGSTAWDDTPLYLWDEWNAYVNGTEVAIDRFEAGLWTEGWRDAAMGPVEFTVYAFAVAMAVEAGDAAYFRDNDQFHAFMRWNALRAMRHYRAASVMEPFVWDQQEAYYASFRTGTPGASIRDFISRVYGEDFLNELLDL